MSAVGKTAWQLNSDFLPQDAVESKRSLDFKDKFMENESTEIAETVSGPGCL